MLFERARLQPRRIAKLKAAPLGAEVGFPQRLKPVVPVACAARLKACPFKTPALRYRSNLATFQRWAALLSSQRSPYLPENAVTGGRCLANSKSNGRSFASA